MKNSLLFLSFLFLTATAFAQNTLIVDNTGSAPTGDHVYTNLQTAIDAAQEGDIIHVMPSPTSYGDITIEKDNSGISIFGNGYLATNIINRSMIGSTTIKGDNIRLSGITFFSSTNSLVISSDDPLDKANNIIIDNTEVEGYRLKVEYASNVLFKGCFITASGQGSSSTRSEITNNSEGVVFSNSIVLSTFDDLYNTEFYYTIIQGGLGFLSAGILSENAFTNSIILLSSLTSNEDNITNNDFENNYSSTSLQIGTNGNIGADNIINEGVIDVFESDGTNWLNEFNPNLPEGSSLIGAASDGSDLGVFGGSSPYSQTGISLPYIQELIAPLTIKKGSDTEVTIKAKGN